MSIKSFNLHLISDHSINTVKAISESIKSRIFNVEIKEFLWPMVKNDISINNMLNFIAENPGLIIYTITNDKIRYKIKDFGNKNNIVCISAIGRIIKEVSNYIGKDKIQGSNDEEKFDDDYFDRINAIEYSIKHDDGQNISTINYADIILLGSSRTSKTPTSIYLANMGYKTANVPLVGFNFPLEILLNNNSSLIIGLVIEDQRLIKIRNNRAKKMNLDSNSSYCSFNSVVEECLNINRFFNTNNITTINVTNKGIEEIASEVISIFVQRKTNKIS